MMARLPVRQATGRLRALIAVMLLLAAAPVLPAAAEECVLDKCQSGATTAAPASPQAPAAAPDAPTAPARFGPAATGAFDFYVLSLSWSPGFCDTGGDAKAPDQCAAGSNLGFVVHGLWPQNDRGFPSNCDGGSRFPSRAVLDGVRDLYPDVGLARYEWRKHGTCTGLSPTDYFASVRQARGAVTVPSILQHPNEPQTLAPLDIARAFMAGNRSLRADTMAVTCRQGELEEVRLCFAKDLRSFVSCPEVARDACRSRSIDVMPVR